MGLPVTVYRWDDAGAPQLTTSRKPSEIINILKKCLVDGYGSKPSLGWTKEFEDIANQKVVFRNSSTTGSGGFVRFASLGGSDAAATFMTIRAGMSMSDVDTFFKETSYQRGITVSAFTSIHWFLIGTSSAFYFMLSNSAYTLLAQNGYSLERGCFVGDFKSYLPADQCTFIALADYVNGDQTSNAGSATQAFYNHFYGVYAITQAGDSSYQNRIHGADGSNVSMNYGVRLTCMCISNASYVQSLNNMGLYASAHLAVSSQSSQTTVTDVDGVNIRNSVITPLVRGELPGLKVEIMQRYNNQSWPKIELIDGKNHWLLRAAFYTAGVWINMEEW